MKYQTVLGSSWRPSNLPIPVAIPQTIPTTGAPLNYFMLKLPEAIPVLMISKLSPDAIQPYKATPAAVGFDLYACEDCEIPPFKITTISTGIRATPPTGYYLQITGRSGLSQNGFLVITGIIDPDYTGAIGIMVLNVTNSSFFIKKGNRIAQMIPTKFASQCTAVMLNQSDLSMNDDLAIAAGARGARGFGSSGL